MRGSENIRFKVSFTLDDDDAHYFRKRYGRAKSAARARSPDAILKGARETVARVRSGKYAPRFVLAAIATLEDLAKLVEDEWYAPPASVRNQVLAGIAYFSDPQDLIPDDIPGVGFLDDAIILSLIAHEFKHELRGYRRFTLLRDALHQRPDTPVGRQVLVERVPALRKRIRAEIIAAETREAERSGSPLISW